MVHVDEEPTVELLNALRLEGIFYPTAYAKRAKIREQGGRFVHYTSAENATKILRSKTIWLRNAKCMNDYTEILHGHEQLVRLFNNSGSYRAAFYEALKPFGENLGEQVIKQFDEWWSNIQHNTYICSISEHDASEDQYGRLSMWRAYGRVAGKAAIVLKLPLTPGAARGLKLLVSPAAYWSYEEIEAEFNLVLNKIRESQSFLITVSPEQIKNSIFYMLIMSAVCIKHAAFREEREWRVVYLPHIDGTEHIDRSIEVIDGIPQPIYKIPLVDKPEFNITGVEIRDLVDRVLIGPSVFPAPMFEAFATILHEAGMPDAVAKVSISHIPLRA